MKELLVIEPKFYRDFKCVGPACIDVCCQGWGAIHIDKKTYSKYKKSTLIEVRNFVEQSIKVVGEGFLRYAVIKPNHNNACPALKVDGLCMIHSKLGESALSHTCKTYPRIEIKNQNEIKRSLTLSCPETAKLVLYDVDSMKLEECHILVNQSDPTVERFNLNEKILNLFLMNIFLNQDHSLESDLKVALSFILFAQKLNFELVDNIELVESYFDLINQRSDLPNDKNDESIENATWKNKFYFLKLLSTLGNDCSDDRGIKHLLHYNQLTAEYFDQFSANDVDLLPQKFLNMNTEWGNLNQQEVLGNGNSMKNYILYILFTKPISIHRKNVLRQFYYLVVDYYYIKSSLSIKSLVNSLSQQDVINFIYGYHVLVQHNSILQQAIDELINELNIGDDISSLFLIS